MTTTDKKIDNALQWIETLAITDEKQDKGRLGDVISGFCCLGLGAYDQDIAFKPGQGGAPKKFQECIGLLHHLGDSATPEEVGLNAESLSELNDDKGLTFKQIARVLKKHPHSYFKTEVAVTIELAYS